MITFSIGVVPTQAFALQQLSPIILEKPQCKECRIAVQFLVRLGDAERGLVGDNFAIQLDPAGRFLVSYPENGSELLAFDAIDGTLLKTAGRRGRGPGEFLWIDKLIVQGGRIHVFDTDGRRYTRLNADFESEHTFPLLAQPVHAAVLSDSVFVVNSIIRTRELAGMPIHVLDRAGAIVTSIGDPAAGYRADMPAVDWWALARASATEFWSGRVTRFLIEKRDIRGVVSRSYMFRRSDLRSYVGMCCTMHPEKPPEPLLRALQDDGQGRLWIISTVADRSWARGIEPVPGRPGVYRPKDWNRFFDTIVDVIDTRAGLWLASHRIDEAVWAFAGPDLVASYNVSTDDGYPRIDVWKLSLLTGRQE